MKKINVKDLMSNAVSLFDERWALITAGTEKSFNTMTASWGGMGELWNKDVCFIFIRPQRYTYEFTEREDYFTVSVFPEEYRKALSFCGRNSGRDVDKIKETGLTPLVLENGIAFEESEITLVCKKLYFQDINPDGFVEKELDGINYKSGDYHRMYIGEITQAYISE